MNIFHITVAALVGTMAVFGVTIATKVSTPLAHAQVNQSAESSVDLSAINLVIARIDEECRSAFSPRGEEAVLDCRRKFLTLELEKRKRAIDAIIYQRIHR